eukprot:CAMPEP_0180140594 /NCGR_PEP_ID=MMETSP0986-20121125/14339_1 /TAXON_ID=697907 /ORGANISM="non described non described, Strain CCMP2293" /LENGTH=231 /DNA_ID=CAMNT_0022083153 /DNA_START=18 /DNA_END=713 /DNA_ORIENTATION=+
MWVRALSLAAIAASSVSAFAPLGAPMGLSQRAAPAISCGRAPAVAPFGLRMADDAPEAEVAYKIGTRAMAISAAIAHPPSVAADGDIRQIIPHRYPFLLVDKILEHVPGESAVGIKCITANEPQFTGHFPDNPIMPGVLQIEAMAQLGGFIALQPPLAEKGQNFFFGGVDNVRWKKPLVPGDVLVMEMKVKVFKKKFGICKMEGKAYVDGKIAVEADFTFAVVTPPPAVAA